MNFQQQGELTQKQKLEIWRQQKTNPLNVKTTNNGHRYTLGQSGKKDSSVFRNMHNRENQEPLISNSTSPFRMQAHKR